MVSPAPRVLLPGAMALNSMAWVSLDGHCVVTRNSTGVPERTVAGTTSRVIRTGLPRQLFAKPVGLPKLGAMGFKGFKLMPQ